MSKNRAVQILAAHTARLFLLYIQLAGFLQCTAPQQQFVYYTT